ncbi:MAG: tetraacyldisaccharide 4'-kinase [Prevotella sp.]|nr:tetraacyldisaccharide 4'-kinase [Prevotella sp.]
MEGDFIKINEWLLPLSWLYGVGVKLRNLLFETGVLKSRSFQVPVISVGNITVGGTGKTPHVEYLIELLRDKFKVAVLSRGYKRKSRGYILADDSSTESDIGDEPFQMKQKYADISIAVDKDRCHGIDQLTDNDKKLDVILLDDAFQHRYVKPGINILLVDYHRLIIYDRLLPAGRLREPLSGKNRADIVIITKCPHDLKPMEFRVITKAMDLYPYQHLFFTTLEYKPLRQLFIDADDAAVMADNGPLFANAKPEPRQRPLSSLRSGEHVLLLTGIASPKQMIHDITPYTTHIHPLTFADHHRFTPKDIDSINSTFAALPSPRIIITTEKDATRLNDVAEALSDDVRRNIYVLPLKIKFMQEQDNMFNENIIGYVRKNSRNSILAKRKDDHKPKDSHRSGNRPRTISFRNN